MPADAVGASRENRLGQCPLGLDEQDPCPRGRKGLCAGPRVGKAPGLHFWHQMADSVRVQTDSRPRRLDPGWDWIWGLKASEEPTFRTWEDTDPNPPPTVRAGAPLGVFV